MKWRRIIRALAIAVACLTAFAGILYFLTAPKNAKPAKVLTLGGLARKLADDPKTFDAIVDKLGSNGEGFMGSAEKAALQRLFRAQDYEALDRLPRVHLGELAIALRGLAEQRPYVSREEKLAAIVEPLGIPAAGAPLTGQPFQSELGLGITYGDRLDPEKGARFRDSERLTAVIDRLALNGDGVPVYGVSFQGKTATTAASFVGLLAENAHDVEVIDERFAANFGDVERDHEPVATPLWVLTGFKLANGGELALPAVHAQIRILIRGPVVNGDLTFYNTLDIGGGGGGGTIFRSDVTADQPWVGGNIAHRWRGAEAEKAMRVMALLRRATRDKVRAHQIPLDGYFALGACTLAPALVEHALTGKTTIWPMTHDPALFSDDTELDRMVRVLPRDDDALPPDPARLFGSLPWKRIDDVPFPHLIPELRELERSYKGSGS